jgi:hypothetical protein
MTQMTDFRRSSIEFPHLVSPDAWGSARRGRRSGAVRAVAETSGISALSIAPPAAFIGDGIKMPC